MPEILWLKLIIADQNVGASIAGLTAANRVARISVFPFPIYRNAKTLFYEECTQTTGIFDPAFNKSLKSGWRESA